ncbi:hypothetical protein D3C87_1290450 [compost metagenome]
MMVSLPGLVWMLWRGERSDRVGRVMTRDAAKRRIRSSVTFRRVFSEGRMSVYLPSKLTGTTGETTITFWPAPLGLALSTVREAPDDVYSVSSIRTPKFTLSGMSANSVRISVIR